MFSKNEVKNNIRPICLKYSDLFDKVVLFGSYSRDEQKEGSDIDLYIESALATGKALRSKDFRNFEYDVYDVFDNKLAFDFLLFGGKRDLSQVRKSQLYKQVMKDGIVIYDKRAETI